MAPHRGSVLRVVQLPLRARDRMFADGIGTPDPTPKHLVNCCL